MNIFREQFFFLSHSKSKFPSLDDSEYNDPQLNVDVSKIWVFERLRFSFFFPFSNFFPQKCRYAGMLVTIFSKVGILVRSQTF